MEYPYFNFLLFEKRSGMLVNEGSSSFFAVWKSGGVISGGSKIGHLQWWGCIFAEPMKHDSFNPSDEKTNIPVHCSCSVLWHYVTTESKAGLSETPIYIPARAGIAGSWFWNSSEAYPRQCQPLFDAVWRKQSLQQVNTICSVPPKRIRGLRPILSSGRHWLQWCRRQRDTSRQSFRDLRQ